MDKPRLSRWMMALGIALGSLGLGAVLSWNLLPVLAPRLVREHSPWFGPWVRSFREADETETVLADDITGRFGDQIPALIRYARSKDPDMRYRGVALLSKFRDSRAADCLAAAAMEPGNTRMRHIALSTLLAMQAENVVPVCIALTRDSDAEMRLYAVRYMPQDARGTAAMLEALKDQDPKVRIQAAEQIRYFKGPERTEPLIAALRDPEPEVRRLVLEALGRIELTPDQRRRVAELSDQ